MLKGDDCLGLRGKCINLLPRHLYKDRRPEWLVKKGEEEEEDAGPAMKLSWSPKGEDCTFPLLLENRMITGTSDYLFLTPTFFPTFSIPDFLGTQESTQRPPMFWFHSLVIHGRWEGQFFPLEGRSE